MKKTNFLTTIFNKKLIKLIPKIFGYVKKNIIFGDIANFRVQKKHPPNLISECFIISICLP